jgi:murein DD-endopeptidase MepM/ murein hydrolase activator NlpD
MGAGAEVQKYAVALGIALVFGAARAALGQVGDEDLPRDPAARLAAIDARIAQALSEMEHASAERERATAELEGLAQGRAAANRRLRDHTRALYRMSRGGTLPIAGGFAAMLRHITRVKRLERMVEHDLASLDQLRRRAEALRAETLRLAEQVEAARARVERLQAEKAGLEEQARRGSLDASAWVEVPVSGPLRAAETYDSATGYGIRVHDAPPAPIHFESQRGRLALPITAPRAIRESTREDGAGLEFDGARGAPVRAAAAGRVAFSGRHPSYGRMVILDHENGWFTVYSGLARVAVEVGDQVSRGMQLGTVEGEPLFFQVRRGTRAQDSRAWLGI